MGHSPPSRPSPLEFGLNRWDSVGVLAGRVKYAVIAAVVVAGLTAASIAVWTAPDQLRPANRSAAKSAPSPGGPVTDWEAIQAAASLRQNALQPHHTAFHRAFAAYMALSTLLQVHRRLRGRCAVAVSYLYDNLLDLHDAYTGEDWTPLRQAVATEPSLQACAPGRSSRRVHYVE